MRNAAFIKTRRWNIANLFHFTADKSCFFFKHRAIIMVMGRGNALIDVFWSVLITLCFFFLIIGFCAREADIWLPWLSVGTHPGKFYTHYYSYTWLIWNYPVQTSLHNRSEYLILFTYFDVCVKTNNKKAFQTLLLINQIEILSWFNFFCNILHLLIILLRYLQ